MQTVSRKIIRNVMSYRRLVLLKSVYITVLSVSGTCIIYFGYWEYKVSLGIKLQRLKDSIT